MIPDFLAELGGEGGEEWEGCEGGHGGVRLRLKREGKLAVLVAIDSVGD